MSELSLEEQSFRNLVHFYSEKLRLVLNGTLATELFTLNERRSLVRRRILQVEHHRGGKISTVTPEARELLEVLEIAA